MDEFEVQDIIDSFYKISDCIYIQNIAILEDTICKYIFFSNFFRDTERHFCHK